MDTTQTAPSGPHVLGSSFRRSSTDRVLLGLCAGLARATGTSTLAVRLATIALGVVLFPLVLLAYIVTALILPRDDGSTLIGNGARNRRDVIIAIAMTLFAAPAVLGAAADHGLTSGDGWLPLLLMGAGAAMVLWYTGRRAARQAAASPAQQAAHEAYAAYTPAAPTQGADPTAAIAAFGDPFSGQVSGPYPPETAETAVQPPAETAATEIVKPAVPGQPDATAVQATSEQPDATLIQPATPEPEQPAFVQSAAGATTGGPNFVRPGTPPTATGGGEPNPPAKKRPSVALPILAVMAVIPALFAVLIAVGAVEANWESLSVMLAILALASAGGAVAIALLRPSYLGAGLLVILAALIGTSSIVVHQVGPFTEDGVGERIYRPASTAELKPVYTLGIGQLNLDLRGLDLRPGSKTTVRAKIGLGQIRIAIPAGVRVIAAPGSDVTGLTLTARQNGASKAESAAAPTLALNLTAKAGDTQLLSGQSVSFDRLEVLHDQSAGFWDNGDTANENRPPVRVRSTTTP
jgi:phage shock protein PspC (stress-responsive transcriptional regulator)